MLSPNVFAFALLNYSLYLADNELLHDLAPCGSSKIGLSILEMAEFTPSSLLLSFEVYYASLIRIS